MKNTVRIGIDTGGTFTDFYIERNGAVEIKKIPSFPPLEGNPERFLIIRSMIYAI